MDPTKVWPGLRRQPKGNLNSSGNCLTIPDLGQVTINDVGASTPARRERQDTLLDKGDDVPVHGGIRHIHQNPAVPDFCGRHDAARPVALGKKSVKYVAFTGSQLDTRKNLSGFGIL
jgi:hypothetical protein